MPVRDIETFWPVRADPPRVLCNRGANGIDGSVSSAFGAAAASDGPVVLLIGDVALAYDIGGLLACKRLGVKLTIVLLDNNGGGIFDFLPVSRVAMAREVNRGRHTGEEWRVENRISASRSDEQDIYTQHISTPTGLDFAKVAELYGLEYERVETIPALRAALESSLAPQAGSTIVHVKTDRTANVKLHGRVWGAVAKTSRADADGSPGNDTKGRG